MTNLILAASLVALCTGARSDPVLPDNRTEAETRATSPPTENALRALIATAKQSGDWDDAAKCLAELWRQIPESPMPEVFPPIQTPLVVASTFLLLERSEQTRIYLGATRDTFTSKVVRDAASIGEIGNWLHLNLFLRDADGLVLEWFDRQTIKQVDPKYFEMFAITLDPLLRRCGRWADLPRLTANPVEAVRLTLAPPPYLGSKKSAEDGWKNRDLNPADADFVADLQEGIERKIIDRACGLYAGLLAAHRFVEASEAAILIRRAMGDREGRTYMIRYAISANAVTAAHVEWLDQAAADDPSLIDMRDRARKVLREDDESPERTQRKQ